MVCTMLDRVFDSSQLILVPKKYVFVRVSALQKR